MEINKNDIQIIENKDAGGGATIDVYFNPVEKIIKEEKTLSNGEVIEREIPFDEFDAEENDYILEALKEYGFVNENGEFIKSAESDKDILELIESAETYIENIKYKNSEGITIDKEKLKKAVGALYDADISSEIEGDNIKSSIDKIYDEHINKFMEGKEINESIVQQFENSQDCEYLKQEVFDFLTKKLAANKITDEEYDKYLNEFNIDINNFLQSKITKPKPTTKPPNGQKWVWDADSQEWVLKSIV
jgi:hypothetical protein